MHLFDTQRNNALVLKTDKTESIVNELVNFSYIRRCFKHPFKWHNEDNQAHSFLFIPPGNDGA
ncbi:MAG: hypothetical protein ABS68_09250 [Niastella sp. SCN 39-18]|nr:MAG: hypothetical protein ABS68_09250 [Niastella sp. SCN 39-18]OJW10437.1 MAG: hypothetical protein BGO53_09645 [Sphingobacteriales bacterium 39-19]